MVQASWNHQKGTFARPPAEPLIGALFLNAIDAAADSLFNPYAACSACLARRLRTSACGSALLNR
jgi:hypothetical protein